MTKSTEVDETAVARATMVKLLAEGLRANPPRIPAQFVWDKEGLQLFEKITQCEDYYPFAAEGNVLKFNIDRILDTISPGAVVLELGSGSLEKTGIILEGLCRLQRPVDYYALDLSQKELDRTLDRLAQTMPKSSCIRCHPLLGTYEASAEWLAESRVCHDRDVIILWLGSSIANETDTEIRKLLGRFASAYRSSRIRTLQLLVGVDGSQDSTQLSRAYDLSNGLSRRFALNSLGSINRSLGYVVFDPTAWRFRGAWNPVKMQYETCLSPTTKMEIHIDGEAIELAAGDLVRVITSRKLDRLSLEKLVLGAGFSVTQSWKHGTCNYGLYLIEMLE